MKLPDEDRAWLAAELLSSLEKSADDGVAEAWAGEIERRMAEVDAGSAKLLSWEEVSARLEARLRKS